MARRLFNGHTFSEDGWPYVDEGSCTWIVVPGTNPPVHLQIQNGPPLAILGAWAADWNAYIEPLRDADSACWTPGNSVPTSNHPGGTAEDLNWESHAFQARGTLNAAQMATMAEMEAFYEGMVFWAGRWDDPVDEMHSQMGYDTYDQANDRPFPKVFDFIRRKIRADGFSMFRRGAMPAVDAGQVLADATGLNIARAREILPTVTSGLAAAECNNVNRVAMWLAQCGEESAGFSTTEEFASGAEYEGRCSDLGNCSPGDGVKYKGRTWIQITGKAHYREFSEWAFGKGLIESPTQFVDNPVSLGDLRWAGIGAAWYWTVSRPDINALSDAGDVVTVTHRINGGEHGLADRQNRYARAHALGDRLLALTTSGQQPPPPPGPTGDDFMSALSDAEQREVIDLLRWLAAPGTGELRKQFPSRSPLRHLGEGAVDTVSGFTLNVDSSEHVEIVKLLASLGHKPSLALLWDVAHADPVQYPDRQSDRDIAQRILADVTSNNAAVTNEAASMPAQLAAAYAEIARLRQQVAQLQAAPAPASTEVAKIEPAAPTTGQSVGRVVDAGQEWAKVSLAMDKVQQHALDAAMQLLKLQTNGTEQ